MGREGGEVMVKGNQDTRRKGCMDSSTTYFKQLFLLFQKSLQFELPDGAK